MTSVKVVLPSEGVFAEAVLGQSNAAEKIDQTRFWNWNEHPIPILPDSLAPIQTGSRARDVAMPDAGLEAPLAAIQQAQPMPGSGLGAMLGALQKGDMFRNMSAIEQIAALAQRTSQGAQEGAADAGQNATAAQKAFGEAINKLASTAADWHNAQTKSMVELANSPAGQAAIQAGMAAIPGGQTATVMGGLMNAAEGAGGAGKPKPKAEEKPKPKPRAKPKGG